MGVDADLIALRIKVTGGKSGAAEVKALNTEVAASGTAAKSAAAKQAAAQARLAKTATSLRTVGRGLTTYATLPIVGVGVAAGAMALDFDRSMRNVNSIAQLPEKRFDSLKHQVLELAGPTAQAPKTLAEGMYDLVSSGFDAAESVVILRKSALAASAGLTTTEVSTKAVAASLNAYHLPARKAGQVSDTLFETVNRGVLTFDELASTIGDTLPFAAQLHVNLGEVGSALSTMTKQGLSSAEAVTRTKNVLVTLIKPGKALSSALKEVGMSGEELVAKKGLQGALETIVGTTKGNKDEIAALFPNIRALGGVLSLVGQNAKFANEDLAAFKSTTGATNKVLKEQEKSFGFQLQRAWSELSKTLIELGEDLLPVVVPFMLELAHGAAAVAHWFADLPAPMQKVALGAAALAALAGPMLLFASAVLRAATNLGILKATEAGGFALNKGRIGKMALGGAGIAAFAAGQSGVGGKAGEAIGNIGGGAALGFSAAGPWGAAIGGGLGALLTAAPAIISLFKAKPSKMAREVSHLSDAMGSYKSATQGLDRIEHRAARAKHQHTLATQAEKRASRHLVDVLAQYGPNSTRATRAQRHLSEAQRDVAHTAKAEQRAQHLSGFRLKEFRIQSLHAVASIKQLVPQQRHRIRAMREEVNHGRTGIKFLNELEGLEKRVGKEKRKLTGIYADAEARAGKPWAKRLQNLTTLQSRYGDQGKTLVSRLGEQRQELQNLKQMGAPYGPLIEELKETKRLLAEIHLQSPALGGGLGKGPKAPHPGHNAQGTNYWRGGLSLVGERGPELINLPRGSGVIPAPRTRELIGTPQAAQVARREGRGEVRYLIAQPIKIGKKLAAEAVTEAREDAEARL